jgi:hypothetical protein
MTYSPFNFPLAETVPYVPPVFAGLTLSELIGPDRTLPVDFDAKAYGLIFDGSIHAALLSVQPEAAKNRIAPIELTDGTWASSADVLTEATGGIFTPIFSQLPTELAEQVMVVDWSAVLALLPQSASDLVFAA